MRSSLTMSGGTISSIILLYCGFGKLIMPYTLARSVAEDMDNQDQLGIVGFDCNRTNLQVTTFDLNRVDECALPRNANHTTESTLIQIVQLREHIPLKIQRCKVMQSTLGWHCGMHSHSTIANMDIGPQPRQLTSLECRTAFLTHRLDLDSQKIENLQPNHTTVRMHSLAGSVWGEGTCRGSSIQLGGYRYDDVVVKRTYTITLQEKYTVFQKGQQQILGFGDVSCSMESSTCYDYDIGTMVWDLPSTDCYSSDFDSLYAGPAKFITAQNIGTHTEYLQVSPHGRSKFQLFTPLISQSSVCGLEAWTTPYTGLFALKYSSKPPFSVSPLNPTNVDFIKYLEAKFVTFAYGTATTLDDILAQMSTRMCENHRQALLNRLHIIAATPQSANLIIDNKPGIFGRVAGEVVHILQCPPVQVALRKTFECTMEIPIMYRDKSLYMDPRTRIITDVSTKRSCSTLTPVMFKHGNRWVKMDPLYSYAPSPSVVSPHGVIQFNFHQLIEFSQGGIYDPSDLQSLRKFMLFSSRRDAMSSNILTSIEGGTAPQYDLTKAINPSGWSALAKDRLRQLWGKMQGIGEVLTGLMGIYFCIVIIKLVIGMVVRMFSIYRLTGWSWRILAGVWSFLTQNLMISYLRGGPRTQEAGTTVEMQELNPVPDPTPIEIQRPPIGTRIYPTIP